MTKKTETRADLLREARIRGILSHEDRSPPRVRWPGEVLPAGYAEEFLKGRKLRNHHPTPAPHRVKVPGVVRATPRTEK